MRERNKRNIVIGILCVMVVFMSVGYAVLSQNLNINGTANITGSWKIEITDISPEEINEGLSVSTNIEDSKVAGSFVANLKKPTDAVVYTVTVENKGTIDAVLESITPEDYSSGDIKYTTTGKEECKNLDAGATCDFTIKVEYLDTGIGQVPTPNGTEVKQEFTIKYVQEGSNVNTPGGGSSGGEIDNTPAITVDSNGLVTGFNKEKLTNSEGYVVIPATTETGEEIVSIDNGSFAKYNMSLTSVYNETTGEETMAVVIYDEENYDAIEDYLLLMLGGEAETTQTSAIFDRDITPTNLTDKKYENQILQRLATNTAAGYTIYSQSEFRDLLKKMESTGTLSVEHNKMFLDCTVEDPEEALKPASSDIEKLDLTQAIYLKKIDAYTFGDSDDVEGILKEVKLPLGIEEIGDSAFSTANLEVINFPNSIKTIGDNVMAAVNKIIKLDIDMETIPADFLYFSDDIIIENLIIGQNVKSISENLFCKTGSSCYNRNNSIKKLYIDMETIPAGIFNEISIENIIIGSNVKAIESKKESAANNGGAFAKSNVSYLVFEENSKLETIGDSAFFQNQISQLIIPNSVRIIENSAFSHNQIEQLKIPANVTNIGQSAFSTNQISESTLVFEDTIERPCQLTTITGFNNNQFTKLPLLPSTITTIGTLAFSENQISELTIPSSIISIGSSAFGNNSISGILVIPSNVITIENYAFSDNHNLTKIVIKRVDATGMTLEQEWNHLIRTLETVTYYEVVYDPNYIG